MGFFSGLFLGLILGVVLGIGLCVVYDAMTDDDPADWHGGE